MIKNYLWRGKSLQNGEWIESDAIIQFDTADGAGVRLWGNHGYKNVDPSTVGQFAGNCDKCGKPIFDGDIAKVKHEGKIRVGVIQYDAGGVFIFVARGLGWIPLYQLLDESDHIKQIARGGYRSIAAIEIIGNIHDNGDLLESGGK